MSSRGRGRGLGELKRVRGNEPAKKQVRVPKSLDELAEYLHSLNESNLEVYGPEFADMVHLFVGDDENKLVKTVKLIFDSTVGSRDYSKLGCGICKLIIERGYEAGGTGAFGTKFRAKLLQCFQPKVKDMKEIRSKSIEEWLGIFAFLCEVYCSILVNGQPIAVIGKAIISKIECMLFELEAIDDEMTTICTILKVCGRLLEQQDADSLERILVALRKQVISAKSSCQRRCAIMELIELKQMGWIDRDGYLDKFYVDALTDAMVEDELH